MPPPSPGTTRVGWGAAAPPQGYHAIALEDLLASYAIGIEPAQHGEKSRIGEFKRLSPPLAVDVDGHEPCGGVRPVGRKRDPVIVDVEVGAPGGGQVGRAPPDEGSSV
ncbi:MAG: hypothetical protein ACREJ5_08705 [Geminicoccaceae bacterium]